MFDHVGITVSDLERSRRFYATADGYNIEAVCHRPE